MRLIIKALVQGFAGPLRPGLVIVSGKRSMVPSGNDYETVQAHNLDYDIYLGLESVIATLSHPGISLLVDHEKGVNTNE